MAQEKARPVHEIRLGRIRAALWENTTEKGTRHNVTVSRFIHNTIQKVAGTLRVPSAQLRKHCSSCGCVTWNVPATMKN